MTVATRYRCRACGRVEKFLPERPLTPQHRVRTGCEECNRLTVFSPVGVR